MVDGRLLDIREKVRDRKERKVGWFLSSLHFRIAESNLVCISSSCPPWKMDAHKNLSSFNKAKGKEGIAFNSIFGLKKLFLSLSVLPSFPEWVSGKCLLFLSFDLTPFPPSASVRKETFVSKCVCAPLTLFKASPLDWIAVTKKGVFLSENERQVSWEKANLGKQA